MREILFRGKTADKHEWVYGDLRHTTDEDGRELSVMMITEYSKGITHLVDPETVSQYIGLIDSKSTKIFAGDIVLSDDLVYGEGGLFLIQWNEEWHGWDANRVGAKDDIYTIGELGDMKIVGNSWDAPELLDGKRMTQEGPDR